jgi:Rieske Fe-S protein
MTAENATGRRGFMGAMVALGSAVIAGVLAVPGVGYVLDPLLRRTGSTGRGWRRLGDVASVPTESPVAIPIVGEVRDAWTRYPQQKLGTVYLRRKDDRTVLALTAECPHLGCSIGFDQTRNRFQCPCHESAFDLEGRKLGGPAPRGMDQLETRVTANGKVEVRFVRFRTQKSDRVEIA